MLGLLWLARKASERRCQLEEASRLGFFHEVVEPDKLLDVAISYARCITPDCNTAYAMSKKALQDDVVPVSYTHLQTMALKEIKIGRAHV